MSEYSMPSYFQTMPVIGKEVAHFSEENAAQIQEVEQEIHEIREAALSQLPEQKRGPAQGGARPAL